MAVSVKGRKRHIAVDSLGMPLAISVTAANVHDLTGAKKVLPQVRKSLLQKSFRKIYADGAYIAQTFKAAISLMLNQLAPNELAPDS